LGYTEIQFASRAALISHIQVGIYLTITSGFGHSCSSIDSIASQSCVRGLRTIGDIELKDLNNIAHGPVISTPEAATIAHAWLNELTICANCSQVNSQKIGEEDFFVVLGSDGVWDHMTDQEAVDIGMEYYGRPQEAARKICQSSFDKESEDNITALVVEFSWNSAKVSEAASRIASELASMKAEAKEVDMFADSDDD